MPAVKTGKAIVYVKDNVSKALQAFPYKAEQATFEALGQWRNLFNLYMDRATKWWLPGHVPYWDLKTFKAAEYSVYELMAFTVSLPYLYVDLGTNPHSIYPRDESYLAFRERYNPHLEPGDKVSHMSSYEGGWVKAMRVRHPGIEPRKITDNIMDELEGNFENMLQASINKWFTAAWEAPYTEVTLQY